MRARESSSHDAPREARGHLEYPEPGAYTELFPAAQVVEPGTKLVQTRQSPSRNGAISSFDYSPAVRRLFAFTLGERRLRRYGPIDVETWGV